MRIRVLFVAPILLPTFLAAPDGSSARLRDWPMFHFSLDRRGVNPYEFVLSPTTVGGLKVKWAYPFADGVDSDPIVVRGVAYAGDFFGDLAAIDASSGDVIWQRQLPGCAGSPAISQGKLYVGTCLGGSVYALRAATGEVLWKKQTSGGVFSSPAISGGVVYFGSNDGALWALDARTGAILWSQAYYAESSVAIVAGVVYVGGLFQDVSAFDAATGSLLWSTPVEDIVDATPVIEDDVVYVATSNGNPFKAYALNATNGSIIWSVGIGAPVLTTMAVSQTLLYLGRSEKGGVLAIDKATGATVWSFPTVGEVGFSSPALANGVVYVGDNAGLVYAIDASSGGKLWSYQTGATINFSPAVVNGMLFIGSFDKNLYAFGL